MVPVVSYRFANIPAMGKAATTAATRYFRVCRRVRLVMPRRIVGDTRECAEGSPGVMSAGCLVDPTTPEGTPLTRARHLDDELRELGEVARNVVQLVDLAQAAMEHATKLSNALAGLESLRLNPGASWASDGERARLRQLREVVDRALGLDDRALASPIPAFPRDVPAEYWAVEFLREQGVSNDVAHAAIDRTEGASRKFWTDYSSRDDNDTAGQFCTYCASDPDACVCPTVTKSQPS